MGRINAIITCVLSLTAAFASAHDRLAYVFQIVRHGARAP